MGFWRNFCKLLKLQTLYNFLSKNYLIFEISSAWILDICQHPEVYEDEEVQAASVLCMIKYMTVSSKTCEEKIQLLVTILERSSYPSVKENILIGLADLTTRFPNSIEPWSSHLYAR